MEQEDSTFTDYSDYSDYDNNDLSLMESNKNSTQTESDNLTAEFCTIGKIFSKQSDRFISNIKQKIYINRYT
jgi:hypothetical protein